MRTVATVQPEASPPFPTTIAITARSVKPADETPRSSLHLSDGVTERAMHKIADLNKVLRMVAAGNPRGWNFMHPSRANP